MLTFKAEISPVESSLLCSVVLICNLKEMKH
jgi:hypothetical protein